MGVENNECVVATTWNREAMMKVREWVSKLDADEHSLFAFLPSLMNNKETVFLAPDGSKKGWDTAKQGEALRDRFIEYLSAFDYDDGSSPFDWVEVGYGEFGQKVLRGNNVNCYSDEEYAA